MNINLRFLKPMSLCFIAVAGILLPKASTTGNVSQNSCVSIVEGIPGGHIWLADPVTGLRVEDEQYTAELELLAHVSPSPNHELLAVTRNLTPDYSTARLTIIDATSYKQVKFFDHVTQFVWSPDSRSIAYIWKNSQSQLQLTVASVLEDRQYTREIPSSIKGYLFFSWSNDEQYLLGSSTNADGESALHFYWWSVPNLIFGQTDTGLTSPIQVPKWSLHDHLFAFVGHRPQGTWYLGIISPTAVKPILFRLPLRPNEPFIEWSPDSTQLLLFDAETDRFDVMGLDGSSIWNIGQGIMGRYGTPVWSNDGKSVFFSEQSFGSSGRQVFYKTVAFHVATKTSEIIIQNATEVFIPGNDNLISVDNGAKKSVVLLNGNGKLITTLVTDADALIWVGPIGQHKIAAIWTTFLNRERQLHFTWADKSGDNIHQSDEIIGTRGVTIWDNSDTSVMYASFDNGVYYLERLDLQSGTHVYLLQHLLQLQSMLQLPNTQTRPIFIWYKNIDGSSAMNAYQADGQIIEHIDTGNITVGNGALFWSPDNQHAILDSNSNILTRRSIYLYSKTQNSFQEVRSTTLEFGQVKWSSDSTMFAVVQQVDTQLFSVDVFSANGTFIQHLGTFPGYYLDIMWRTCLELPHIDTF